MFSLQCSTAVHLPGRMHTHITQSGTKTEKPLNFPFMIKLLIHIKIKYQ
jgi:hypothetical protein